MEVFVHSNILINIIYEDVAFTISFFDLVKYDVYEKFLKLLDGGIETNRGFITNGNFKINIISENDENYYKFLEKSGSKPFISIRDYVKDDIKDDMDEINKLVETLTINTNELNMENENYGIDVSEIVYF